MSLVQLCLIESNVSTTPSLLNLYEYKGVNEVTSPTSTLVNNHHLPTLSRYFYPSSDIRCIRSSRHFVLDKTYGLLVLLCLWRRTPLIEILQSYREYKVHEAGISTQQTACILFSWLCWNEVALEIAISRWWIVIVLSKPETHSMWLMMRKAEGDPVDQNSVAVV